MPPFKPIKQLRASEEVLARIKEAILRGRFKVGEKLPSERELTEQFQVSRGVVREALRVLEMTGFVSIRLGPAGGAYVLEISPDSLASGFLDMYLANKLTIPELNQVRMLIEPEVARLAAMKVDNQWRAKLEQALAGERVAFVDFSDRMKRLTTVHFILAEMCGNYLFETMVNSMIKLTHEIVRAVDVNDHSKVHGVGDHEPIAKAVIAGDPQAASQAMRSHLSSFCTNLIEMDLDFRQHRLK